MIFLASVLFDIYGDVSIDALPDTDHGSVSRRVNKQKTLDGGVVILDGGHAEGDRNVTVKWMPGSASEETIIKNLVKNHNQLYLSTIDGCFIAVPGEMRRQRGKTQLKLLIQEKVSE